MLTRIAAIFFVATVSANAAGQGVTQKNEAGTTVYAEVVQADPIIEFVREPVTRELCSDVSSSRTRRSATPLIVGGILGGLIGNQFGSGRGRTATSIAGAALGASLGADHARRRSEGGKPIRHCELTEGYREYERVAGYRVKYRYDGEIHTVETIDHPGKYLKIERFVRPS